MQTEKFVALWLDNRHRLIAYDELFDGTIDGTSVCPRVVVQKGDLSQRCGGDLRPSRSERSGRTVDSRREDYAATQAGTRVIRVLDHVIVGENCVSLAPRGL